MQHIFTSFLEGSDKENKTKHRNSSIIRGLFKETGLQSYLFKSQNHLDLEHALM